MNRRPARSLTKLPAGSSLRIGQVSQSAPIGLDAEAPDSRLTFSLTASTTNRLKAAEVFSVVSPAAPSRPICSKAALAMNMRMPSPLGAAARLSAAYSALLKSIISSDALVSPCGKSAMHGGLDSGRAPALLCAVLGCGAALGRLFLLVT